MVENRFSFRWFIVAFVGGIIGCAGIVHRSITHGEISADLPLEWLDDSHDRITGINFGNKWGAAYVAVEKRPGDVATTLKNWHDNAQTEPTTTEREITAFCGFSGTGKQFVRHYPNGDVHTTVTVFFPTGQLEGYFIEAYNGSPRASVQRDLEEIVKSIRRG